MTSPITWDHYKRLSLEEKLALLRRENRLFHVLFSRQFDLAFLDHMYDLTRKIRTLSQDREGKLWLMDLLRDKKALLHFGQPSTRTFFSFKVACESLGMRVSELQDISRSSEAKGESFEDTIHTLSSYFDVIIMRSFRQEDLERSAGILNQVRLVSAGTGGEEHPTQSLLDMFTLQEAFESSGGFEIK